MGAKAFQHGPAAAARPDPGSLRPLLGAPSVFPPSRATPIKPRQHPAAEPMGADPQPNELPG